MGKGQRSRLARADEVKAKKAAAKKKAKQEKIIHIVSIVVAIALVLGVVGAFSWSMIFDADYYMGKVALKSDNYEVTNGELMYFYRNYEANFLGNSDTAAAYGLDITKPMKDQIYPYSMEGETTQSWYDFLMSSTVTDMQRLMVLAEAANEAGVALSDEEKETIKTNTKDVDFGAIVPGLTAEKIHACMEMIQLATNYQTQVQDGIKYTDADIEKYYGENKNTYNMVDYRMYSFSYKAAEDEGETALSKEEAKKLADELAATGNEAAFIDWLKNYFTNTLKVSDVDKEISATLSEGFGYSEGYVGIDFLFGNDTKAGDIKVFEDESSENFKVFLLIKPAYRNETATKTVRHILIGVDDAEDKDAMAAAKKEADKLLADWKAGKATEESFAALVHDNTDDTGSKETGGLYENFGTGEMVEAFENWAFDAARKPGDTGVVETEYGYHIMYFVSDGAAKWKVDAQSNYVADKYNKEYEDFAAKYAVSVKDSNINKIEDYVD